MRKKLLSLLLALVMVLSMLPMTALAADTDRDGWTFVFQRTVDNKTYVQAYDNGSLSEKEKTDALPAADYTFHLKAVYDGTTRKTVSHDNTDYYVYYAYILTESGQELYLSVSGDTFSLKAGQENAYPFAIYETTRNGGNAYTLLVGVNNEHAVEFTTGGKSAKLEWCDSEWKACQNAYDLVTGGDLSVPYTINYYKDSNDGSTTVREGNNFLGSVTGTAKVGESVTVGKTQYAPAGYTTPGTADKDSITITSTAANNVANVVYTKNTYTLTYELAGGEITSTAGSYTAAGNGAYGTTITTPTVEKEGYTFAGWSPVAPATMPAANLTLTAQWTAEQYDITYELDGGSLGEGTTNPTTYTIETEAFTLNNPTKDGYVFAGWTGTDLTAATTTVTVAQGSTGDRTYTATWDEDDQGLIVDGEEKGDGTPDKYQVFVKFEAADANGTVTDKEGAEANTGVYQVYTFANQATSGDVTPTLDGVVTTPASNYAFDIWTKGDDTAEVNPTANLTDIAGNTTIVFKAHFAEDKKGNPQGGGDGTPDKYQVFVKYEAGANGTLTGDTYAAYNLRQETTAELLTSVTLTFPTPKANSGYQFSKWTNPTGVTVNGTTMSGFTAGKTYTFTANFETAYIPYYPPVVTPATVTVKNLNDIDHVAYIVGTGEGKVSPLGTVTRAEVATIYFRLMTEEFRTQFWSDVNSYSDVADTAWYNVAVSTLENAGVIKDVPTGGEFRPNDPITRAELAVMAAQFCALTGKIPETSFLDVTKDHWAYEEIKLIEYAGWIEGYAGYFRPDDNLTRAECMTIINRMLKRGADEEYMLEDMITFVDNLDTNKWYYEAIQEAVNSHDYTRTNVLLEGEKFYGEKWTVLLDAPDWAAMEQAWIAAAAAAADNQ